jgi:phospholipid/cholesterol/gamma-HCH transport system ATP-binding protein
MGEKYPHYIEFQHIYKTFDYPVLADCCFHVDPGESVAIIGRSGVGKSVTLAHIMGFLKPDQGRVIVAHQDVTDYSESQLRAVRKRVTMVFQSGALFDSLTVAENILFSLELREDYNFENKEAVVRGLLEMVDLYDYRDAYPTDLSTGYNPIMSDHLIRLMLRLKDQLRLTSVVVTHDLELMRRVADKVVFLFDGRVIYFGPVTDLNKSDHPHVHEFLAMDRVEM